MFLTFMNKMTWIKLYIVISKGDIFVKNIVFVSKEFIGT